MDDEYDFKDYKSIEEFGKSLEGSRYYHSLYMRAVAHPVRKKILKLVYKHKRISYEELVEILLKEQIIPTEDNLNYNLDYLIKALCIEEEKDKQTQKRFFSITQSGEVVDYLER